MRIGVDARELVGRPTGVGRYLSGLIRQWAIDPDQREHEFVLYAPSDISIEFATVGGAGVQTLDSRRFPTRIVPGRPGTLWEQVRLPKVAAADHLDVFFSPAYSAPLRFDRPVVVALHDLSFFAHPEWFRTREGVRRRFLARQSATRAASIVTISEFSRDEIIERLSIAATKIYVVPPGIDATPIRRRDANANDARVLFVGSIFNRRHVPDLVRGVVALSRRRRGVSLDLVGDNRTYPREDIVGAIEQQNASTFVTWHEYAGDQHLSDLYAHARAFAFLSEYEGLGLTPLEALSAGVPPLLLDTRVARESCGEAAMYVPDTTPRTIADGLERVLFDDRLRAQILDAAPGVLAGYDWKRAARATLDVFQTAGNLHHGGH